MSRIAALLRSIQKTEFKSTLKNARSSNGAALRVASAAGSGVSAVLETRQSRRLDSRAVFEQDGQGQRWRGHAFSRWLLENDRLRAVAMPMA